MTYKAALVATLVMLSPAVAMASPTCTTAPKDKWMSENAMKSRIATRLHHQDIPGDRQLL